MADRDTDVHMQTETTRKTRASRSRSKTKKTTTKTEKIGKSAILQEERISTSQPQKHRPPTVPVDPNASIGQLLTNQTACLIDNLLVDDVIPILVNSRVISLYQHDTENYSNRARVLIQKLLPLDDQQKEMFRDALMATLQPHLAVLLKQPDIHEVIMTRDHKTTLAEYLQPIRVIMNLEPLLPIMKKQNVFLQAEIDRILFLSYKHDQIVKFITYLMRKPDSAFPRFIQALRATKQNKLADYLENRAPLRHAIIEGPTIRLTPIRERTPAVEPSPVKEPIPVKEPSEPREEVPMEESASSGDDEPEVVMQPEEPVRQEPTCMLRFSIGSAFLERKITYPGGGYALDQDEIDNKRDTFRGILYNQLNNMVKSNKTGALSVLTDVANITDVLQGSKANVHIWVYCPDEETLNSVMSLYHKRDLEKAAEAVFDTNENQTRFGASSLNVYVSTSYDQYLSCRGDIRGLKEQQ